MRTIGHGAVGHGISPEAVPRLCQAARGPLLATKATHRGERETAAAARAPPQRRVERLQLRQQVGAHPRRA